MKRSMGLLASTLLAAGLGIGGTAMAAGPAAADTGLKSVTISAVNYQGYTDHKRDDDKRDWRRDDKRCDRYNHDHGRNGNWHQHKDGRHWHFCDDDHRRGHR
ncbi:hypothetical protein PV761_19145 [Arthrobacter sp. CC3]|uniref:hypothetical protein n=1 Tax=Arthrobacter sp. CC3 TaxID=3029185 RepID=UPI003266A006